MHHQYTGIRAALDFIVQMRKPARQMTFDNIRELCRHADQQGFEFCERDLRMAFKHDWAMRQQRHGAAPICQGT